MANTNLHFRVATVDDAPQISTLIVSAFQAEDSRPSWTADMEMGRRFRYPVEQVRHTIDGAGSAILMATDDSGALVGSVSVMKRTTATTSNNGDNGDHATGATDAVVGRLAMLSVDPGKQQAGIGRRVIAYAEDYCRRTWGAEMMSMNALSTRGVLIDWYLRCGYVKTGERVPFPKELMEGLTLPDDLHFVEMEKKLV